MTRRLLAGARRGQALLLTIIVLLMLALVAAALVAVVADDLDSSARDEERVNARALAWAGIRYADEMLGGSVEGADWRPRLPDYVNPSVGPVAQQQLEDYWDSFERLRGWDSQSVFNAAAGGPRPPVYYVKYRFAMDAEAVSLVTETPDDLSQDFSDPDRLQPIENVERTAPHDHFLLRIEYDPDPARPLSRFLKLTAIGRPGNSPTSFEELVAYKQVSLLDYGLYIHDTHRGPAAAQLGGGVSDIDGDRATGSSARAADDWTVGGPNDFVPLQIQGPVRINSNASLRGPVLLEPYQPTPGGWAGKIEVAGTLATEADANATGGNRQVLLGQSTGDWLTYANNAPGEPTAEDRNQLVSPSGQPWPDALDIGGEAEYPAPLESYEPLTGVSRWERLTRYSGVDIATFEGGVPITVNSGELGYGQGVWLPNTSQREQLEAVKNDWLTPSAWGGRRYVPNGAIIELFAHFPDPLDPGDPPAMVVTRTDGTTWLDPATGLSTGLRSMVFGFPNKDGAWQGGSPAALDVNDPNSWPTPDNGVILCDGTVRVLGRLPASTPADDYNLTIVSRGSIYVEGPLLRPSDWTNAVAPDDPANTRIALLARDHVVINPTVLAPGPVPGMPPGAFTVPPDRPTEAHFTVDAQGTEVIGLSVPLCRNAEDPAGSVTPPQLATILEADGNAGDGVEARSAVIFHKVRATLGLMPDPAGTATVTRPGLLGSGVPEVPGTGAPPWGGSGIPVFFADWAYLGTAAIGPAGSQYEYWPDVYAINPVNFNANPGAGELGVPSYLTVQGGHDWTGLGVRLNRSDVIVKNAKLERLAGNDEAPRAGIDFQVSALLFAERGTFFIIPGDWFDPRADGQLEAADPLNPDADARAARLARIKRYNHRISIDGAVVVNQWPTWMEANEWQAKWSYPADTTPDGSASFAGYDVSAFAGQTIFNEYRAVRYRYDWGFRTLSVRPNRLRLPFLPASPGLVYAGEENKR